MPGTRTRMRGVSLVLETNRCVGHCEKVGAFAIALPAAEFQTDFGLAEKAAMHHPPLAANEIVQKAVRSTHGN